jgi:hypothetical protein
MISKDYSEVVNLKGTDNTMAKRQKQKDTQRSTNNTHTTKDRATRTQIKTESELRCVLF